MSRGTRSGDTFEGVRRFDPYTDMRAVADLITVAFADRLDPAGQMALAQMQRLARRHLLLQWQGWFAWDTNGAGPGFVWVDDGEVVGNVSLRRAGETGGYLIGNVAVHPRWRRRGIAGELMKVALQAVSAQGGRWVGLEVKGDNFVARHLYDRLGFREVGKTLTLLRPPAPPPGANGAIGLPLLMRRARSDDSRALIDLAYLAIPELQRAFFDLRRENYRPGFERELECWLEGRREAWWVVEAQSKLCGAVRALRDRGSHPNRLEVMVSGDCAGQVEPALVRQGLARTPGIWKKIIEVTLPESAAAAIAALEQAGFRKSNVLVQMRLPVEGKRNLAALDGF